MLAQLKQFASGSAIQPSRCLSLACRGYRDDRPNRGALRGTERSGLLSHGHFHMEFGGILV